MLLEQALDPQHLRDERSMEELYHLRDFAAFAAEHPCNLSLGLEIISHAFSSPFSTP